ncbi:MAG TPA: alpha/beta hydrolase [Candidatus Eisenbacteria bacterium]|nr:alpha/beta hydrolase [Candidatus Eisenbacteria bacterium]
MNRPLALLRAGAVAALALAAAAAALGWHVAGRIHREALLASYDHGPETYDDARVVAVDSASIVLVPAADENARVARDGRWSVLDRRGSGRTGRVLRRDAATGGVVRDFRSDGIPPSPGDSVELRLDYYAGDPLRSLGLPFDTIAIATELGPAEAWLVPGPRADAWFLFVHGKAASPRQALRALGVVHGLGYTALAIRYRNDLSAPPSPDGYYHYGATEWRDLEAAVRFAIDRGARRVVLMGTSMGGGIVAAFLERSSLAPSVDAAILDSPMLDFEKTIDWGVAQAVLPGLGIPLPAFAGTLGKRVASWSYGVDWSASDYLDAADSIRAPLLVFHGERDTVVPYASSRELARRVPRLVRLVSFPGADHAEGWNVDSLTYNGAIRDFLARNVDAAAEVR